MIEIKEISIIFANGHYKIEATIEYDLIAGQPELILVPVSGIGWTANEHRAVADTPKQIAEKILDKVQRTVADLRKVHIPTMKLVWEELKIKGLVIEE